MEQLKQRIKKIILTGGGTAGSVSPLLAIADDLKSSFVPPGGTTEDKGGFEFLFIGTKKGIEKQMVKEAGIPYRSIAAGKWRRYFAWQNFFDIFKIKLGFWQAFFIILKEKPDLVISAGSFVAVPVVWAAWLLRVPVLVHQQDVRPGLANKMMAPFARVITVTFEKSLTDYGKKAVWTGNPTRFSISDLRFSNDEAIKRFDLKNNLPVIFIYGGGTGAEAINKLVEAGLDNMLGFCQVIHSTGKDKMNAKRHENYHPYEFLNAEEMAAALNIADLVVSRAGLGALTEISVLGKPAIIIPMPDSHQEDNAALLLEKNAALILNQKILTADEFVVDIGELLKNEELKNIYSRNIKGLMKEGANAKIIELILSILNFQFSILK
jgi:UDP-N-acetylglucosamine--N-acetylmuramyl-(pentapeptide) pyrophosphoryl-undecaprenol N-acetylglucosamine transferase